MEVLWKSLGASEREACEGIFCDRICGAYDKAQNLENAPLVKIFDRPHFESGLLQHLGKQPPETELLVLLCGFFGILSDNFIKKFPGPMVNTHPSLLPSFPGMDKKVHALAEENVAVSGFSVHLVSEVLDGGTILFQHPIWVDVLKEPGALREDVRRAEQQLLPRIWKQILYTDLSKKDLSQTAFQLRRRLGLDRAFFQTKKAD